MPAAALLQRRALCSAAILLLALVTGEAAQAQAPSITGLSPQAVRPGGAVDVTVRGANLAGATGLWTSFPADAALAPDVPENGTKADQVVFRVTVPEGTPAGVQGLRVVTPKGVSPLRLVVVDDLPSVAQQAGNTAPEAAQEITPPVAVDGTVQNLTLNYYRLTLAAGQRLAVEVLAKRIGSALDPMLRVLDPSGREVAWCDDALGLGSDAQLSFAAPVAGQYLIEVRDIRYQGGGNYPYRLRVGDFPCVTTPYPMGARRGTPVALHFAGSDTENVPPLTVAVPADPNRNWLTAAAQRTGGQSSGLAVLAVGDRPEFLETEPNDKAEQANRVELGTNLNGRFESPGDVDRFVFTVKKGQKFTFDAVTRRQGSPTDLRMRLHDAAGKKVAESDDTGTLDGAITYAFPADGDYALEVEDLHGRGGPPFVYRVAVRPAEAGFSLAASADAVNVPAGGTALVTITAARKDYNGPIELAAADLPPGLTSVPTVMGPGLNTAVLTITATKDAAAGQLTPIRIVGTGKQGESEPRAVATVSDVLKAANNGMPYPPQILAESVAAAVAPAAGFRLTAEPAEVVLGQNLSATVKVTAERAAEFDEAIALAVTPEKGALPGGLTVAAQPVAKGANEVSLTISATDKSPLGEFTAVLVGTHTKNKVATAVPLPGLRIKLAPPFELAVDTAGGKLAKGSELKVKVAAHRNPAFSGPITVTLQNLPKGVTATPATIAADQTEIEIPLTATAEAAVGTVDKLTAKGDAQAGKAALSAVSPEVSLTVE